MYSVTLKPMNRSLLFAVVVQALQWCRRQRKWIRKRWCWIRNWIRCWAGILSAMDATFDFLRSSSSSFLCSSACDAAYNLLRRLPPPPPSPLAAAARVLDNQCGISRPVSQLVGNGEAALGEYISLASAGCNG